METELEKLTAQALKLTLSERAAFAQMLLASLDEDNSLDQAWSAEIECRLQEIDNGTAETVPVADAIAGIRAKLK